MNLLKVMGNKNYFNICKIVRKLGDILCSVYLLVCVLLFE